MQRFGLAWLLMLSSLAAAEPPAADVGRLLELNRDSEHQLRQLQHDGNDNPSLSGSQRARHAGQRDAQRLLQDRQHRQLLRDHHRARTGTLNAVVPRHPAVRQQQFRIEQQRQLQRFGGRQGLRR